MRLCESSRIDAELRRHYRGLAPRVENLNLALVNRLNPLSLSTLLVRASLGLISPDEYATARIRRAGLDVLRAAA